MSSPLAAPRGAASSWWIAAGVAAVNVLARLPRLGAKDLWLDEAVAVHIAQLDPLGIVAASRADTTPPLYYLVLAGFERILGIEQWAVRLPSVLAGGVLGAALFLVADRWMGRFAALTAAALFLVSDVHLNFAHEARPYTLAALLCTASYAVFLEARERTSWRPWILLALVNTALLLTHYLGVFAILSQALALVVTRRRDELWRLVAVHLPVAAGFLAWTLPLLRSGEQGKMGWLALPTVFHAAKLLGWYTGGHRGFPGFLLLLAGTVVALRRAWRRGDGPPRDLVAVLATWAFGPLLLAFVASHAGLRSFHPRYVLYASCGLILLWAAGVTALPRGRWRALGAGVAILVGGLGFGRSLSGAAPSWHRAADLVRAAAPARILLFPYFEMTTFAYHYDRAAFTDAARTQAHLADDGVRAVVGPASIASLDLEVPELVVVHGPTLAPFAPVEHALAERGFVEVERRPLPGIEVLRLARAAGAAR